MPAVQKKSGHTRRRSLEEKFFGKSGIMLKSVNIIQRDKITNLVRTHVKNNNKFAFQEEQKVYNKLCLKCSKII